MSERENFIQFEVLAPESCEGCGLCCERNGSPVLLYASRPGMSEPHPFRPPGLPEELIREIDDQFAGLFRGQEPQECCFWFDPQTRRCRHYEWRPQVCRDYELGGTACLSERRPHVKPRERRHVSQAATEATACIDSRNRGVPAKPSFGPQTAAGAAKESTRDDA